MRYIYIGLFIIGIEVCCLSTHRLSKPQNHTKLATFHQNPILNIQSALWFQNVAPLCHSLIPFCAYRQAYETYRSCHIGEKCPNQNADYRIHIHMDINIAGV